MSYLDTSKFGAVPEIKLLDNGTEVRLQIKKAEEGLSKAGNPQITLLLVDPSDDLVDDVYNYITIPTEELRDSDPKKFAKTVRYLNEFLECFGIDSSQGFDTERDLVGASGWVIVSQEEFEGRMSNKIKKLVRAR
jgi:hypothetical protein